MKFLISTHSVYQLSSIAVPNPPTLTTTPLYNSSGGLLEIESHATEGVSSLCGDCALAFLQLAFYCLYLDHPPPPPHNTITFWYV